MNHFFAFLLIEDEIANRKREMKKMINEDEEQTVIPGNNT